MAAPWRAKDCGGEGEAVEVLAEACWGWSHGGKDKGVAGSCNDSAGV